MGQLKKTNILRCGEKNDHSWGAISCGTPNGGTALKKMVPDTGIDSGSHATSGKGGGK